MPGRGGIPGAILLAAMALGAPQHAPAQAAINWDNALGGAYDVAGNWNPAQVPTGSDTVTVALAGTYTIDVSAANAAADVLNITNPDASIDITAGAVARSLSAATSLSNAGTINMSTTGSGIVTLAAFSGTVTNSGTINALNGGGSGTHRFSIQTLNNAAAGDININRDTEYVDFGGVFSNSGDVAVAAGQTLSFGNSTTFNQDGGTLDVQGSFLMSTDTFNFNGGTITGVVDMTGGGTLAIGAGSTGAGEFNIAGGSTAYSGDLAAAQTVNINAAAVLANLNAASSFANDGTINLNTGGSAIATLSATASTITNNSVINVNPGGGSGANRLSIAVLQNAAGGTINIGKDTDFFQFGGDFNNEGDVNVAAGQTLT
ncbi:MAG: hypothetical protein HKO57_05795, partial [Akkermansiaceae bacterium]|nr:hypothetical protein [Akkermansiaceae bacterium]